MPWLAATWQVFGVATIAHAAEALRAFGPWTALVSLLLMVIQSLASPLPGSLVAAANGVIFGVWWGTLLSYTGGLLGSAATFWLGRRLGRRTLGRRAHEGWLAQVDRLGEAHGFWIVLAARLTPIVSLDVIGYLARLSRMSFRRYMLANAIGVAPGMWAYTALGSNHALARASAKGGALLLVAGPALHGVGRWWLGRLGVRETQ